LSEASDESGVPPLVAFPHCVTPMNTFDGVAFGVVTVTVVVPPEVSPEDGDALTVADAATAAPAQAK
jgi:hypothetical protein